MISIDVHCIGIALIMISKVVQLNKHCIVINLLISIVVQLNKHCIVINLLMISIVVQCIGLHCS